MTAAIKSFMDNSKFQLDLTQSFRGGVFVTPVLALNIRMVPAWLCNVKEWQKVSRKGEIPQARVAIH
jgi:hypothetical protein